MKRSEKRLDKGFIALRPIATFDESIRAAQIVSRAVERGALDDAGDAAEITPNELIIENAQVIGVVAAIRPEPS